MDQPSPFELKAIDKMLKFFFPGRKLVVSPPSKTISETLQQILACTFPST
jgi:hypothetical protein